MIMAKQCLQLVEAGRKASLSATPQLTIFLLIFIMLTTSPTHGSSDLSIHLLDVGQGDAMILHQPGSCTTLIDAGPLIRGHQLTSRVRQLGVEALDYVIVTHPHLDHFGGLFDLLPRVTTRQLYDNGLANSAYEYFDDYQALRDTHPYRVLSRGDQIRCGDVEIEVLYPGPDPDPEVKLNDTSLAMMVTFGDFRLLHMGDLAGDGADRFLESEPDIEADIIKVAHHGAADSASEDLLRRASPQHALISTSAPNRIGSPAAEVLTRLDKMGINWLRTDLSGDIEIIISGGTYQVQAASP